MRKTWYTDYVRHCLRFYARYPDRICKNEIEYNNWSACQRALEHEKYAPIIVSIFSAYTPVESAIQSEADKCGVTENQIWKLVSRIEEKVAVERGLK